MLFLIAVYIIDAFYNEFSSSKNKGIEVDEYLDTNRGDFKKRDYCVMFP